MQFRNPRNDGRLDGVQPNITPNQPSSASQNQPNVNQPNPSQQAGNYSSYPPRAQQANQQYPVPNQPNQPPANNQYPQNNPTQPQPQPIRPTGQTTNIYSQPQQPAPAPAPNNLPNPAPINGQISVDTTLESPHKKTKKEEVRNTIYTLVLFILAPLFAIFMIVFVFQSYVVDGTSMDPTLQNNDRVFILKLPKSIAKITNNEYVPQRNEVIVFKKPDIENTQLIKRVIGLPGDRVVIENGEVTVYNIDNPAGFDPGEGTDYIDGLASYDAANPKIEANVGEGELFVLGDNRTPGGSLDSHSGLGLVPIENVVGRLWIRYFPISSFEVFSYLEQRLANSLL